MRSILVLRDMSRRLLGAWLLCCLGWLDCCRWDEDVLGDGCGCGLRVVDLVSLVYKRELGFGADNTYWMSLGLRDRLVGEGEMGK